MTRSRDFAKGATRTEFDYTATLVKQPLQEMIMILNHFHILLDK